MRVWVAGGGDGASCNKISSSTVVLSRSAAGPSSSLSLSASANASRIITPKTLSCCILLEAQSSSQRPSMEETRPLSRDRSSAFFVRWSSSIHTISCSVWRRVSSNLHFRSRLGPEISLPKSFPVLLRPPLRSLIVQFTSRKV